MEKNFFREKIEKIKEDYDPNKNCSVIYSIQIIGAKWKVPILWNLMLEDGIHYNQLKRKVNGITNTMLTKCIKELEKDGIIRRVSYGSIPPSVTYHLTDIGKELIYAFEELKKWGLLHMESKIK